MRILISCRLKMISLAIKSRKDSPKEIEVTRCNWANTILMNSTSRTAENAKSFSQGQRPGIVIMHEIPGITPKVANFAGIVAKEGFTVFLPVMFGTPGKPSSGLYSGLQVARACISKEFNCLAKHESSPITDWLRALCRHAFEQCGGRGVGAIGMCLTGGFALSLMVDEFVMAPVLSQPSCRCFTSQQSIRLPLESQAKSLKSLSRGHRRA